MNEKQREPLRVAAIARYSSHVPWARPIQVGQIFTSQRDAAMALVCTQPAVCQAMRCNDGWIRGVKLERLPQIQVEGECDGR